MYPNLIHSYIFILISQNIMLKVVYYVITYTGSNIKKKQGLLNSCLEMYYSGFNGVEGCLNLSAYRCGY